MQPKSTNLANRYSFAKLSLRSFYTKVLLVALVLSTGLSNLIAQVTLTANRSALVKFSTGSSSVGNTAYGTSTYMYAYGSKSAQYYDWHRTLFDFDVDGQIPFGSIVTSALLNITGVTGTEVHRSTAISSTYNSNAAYLQCITGAWTASTVTWNTKPGTTTTNQASLAASTTASQSYSNIDVKAMVQNMVDNPAGTHGFMFQLQSESVTSSARMTFYSNTYGTAASRPKLAVTYTAPINAGTISSIYPPSNTYNSGAKSPTSYVNHLKSSTNQAGQDIFIKFTVSSLVKITINTVASNITDTYVHLLNASGTEIASSGSTGLASLSYNIPAGTYYAVVEPKTAATTPTQTITTTITTSNPIGSFLSDPIIIGQLNTGSSYLHNVDNATANNYMNDYTAANPSGQSSDDVYYKFSVSSPSVVKISAVQSNPAASLHLLDGSGNHIASNELNSSSNIYQDVTPGNTYYVVAETFVSSYTYQTKIDIYNRGDKKEAPFIVPDLTNGGSYSHTVNNSTGFQDDFTLGTTYPSPDVYYKLTVPTYSKVTISYVGSSGCNVHMVLVDANLTNSFASLDQYYEPATTSRSANVPPGTYYVMTEGCQSTTGNLKTTISISAAPLTSTEDMNYIQTNLYDWAGNLTGQAIGYYDALGNSVQSLSRSIASNRLITSATLYDAAGRGVLYTLAVPVNQDNLDYVANFITDASGNAYTYEDFDITPKTPGALGSTCKLQQYYSNNNTDEPYVAATAYPYTRVEYSKTQPGLVRRSTLAGEDYRLGSNHEGQTYTVSASADELAWFNTNIFFSDLLDKVECYGLTKTITIDADGNENISYNTSDGKLIATCVPGGNLNANRTLTYYLSKANYNYADEYGYVDFYLPKSTSTFAITKSGSWTFDLINLKDDSKPYTNSTVTNFNLASGVYRMVYKGDYPGNAYSFNVTITAPNTYCTHYSFNFYDKVGRLKRSISPKGVAELIAFGTPLAGSVVNTYCTLYQYNSLGQLLYVTSPDEGATNYLYRKDGKIRFSQNAEQAKLKDGKYRYSYTNYDNAGRIVEVGEAFTTGTFASLIPDDKPIRTGDITSSQTYYMFDQFDAAFNLSGYTQHNTMGRLVKTWNNSAITWYSYTYDGKVEWIVQSLIGFDKDNSGTPNTSNDYIRLNYQYEAAIGLLTQTIYQQGQTDEFTHRYEYDADLRLKKAYTKAGTAGTEKLQATYYYYQLGQLKRVELAENLQGIDYVYTINGWLKGINDPGLDKAKDPGKDGNTGSHVAFKEDVFGMNLDYFSGDYTRTNSNIISNPQANMYTGNISQMRYKTKELDASLATGVQNAMNFNYDQFGQLLLSNCRTYNAGTGSFSTLTNAFKTSYSYDDNGNIKTLSRYNGSATQIDNLGYNYYDINNRLKYIADAIAGSTVPDEIINQSSLGNYFYNDIGQMTQSNSENQKFEYNPYGHVIKIKSKDLDAELASYAYNANGFRIYKKMTRSNGTYKETWYLRDGSGNILNVYENESSAPSNKCTEINIYAGSRLGTARLNADGTIGKYLYELRDHLGNVRAVVADNYPTTGTLENSYDYYPGGWEMPLRQNNGSKAYRFGYQGQFAEREEETNYDQFEARLYDARICRWMVPDPAKQYFSPYLSMGNNWIILVDPNGKQSNDIYYFFSYLVQSTNFNERLAVEKAQYVLNIACEVTKDAVPVAVGIAAIILSDGAILPILGGIANIGGGGANMYFDIAGLSKQSPTSISGFVLVTINYSNGKEVFSENIIAWADLVESSLSINLGKLTSLETFANETWKIMNVVVDANQAYFGEKTPNPVFYIDQTMIDMPIDNNSLDLKVRQIDISPESIPEVDYSNYFNK